MYQSFELRNFRCFGTLVLSGLKRLNLITGRNNVGKTSLLEALFLHCGAYDPELILRLNGFRGVEALKVEIGHTSPSLWDSIFGGFEVGRAIELTGRFGRGSTLVSRTLRIRSVTDVNHLRKLVPPEPSPANGTSVSSELPQLLEVESTEGKQVKRYRMWVEQDGVRIEPLPLPPPFPAIFLGSRSRIPPREDAERFGKLELMREQDAVVEVLRVIEPRLQRLAVVVAAGSPMLFGDIGLRRLVPLPFMGEGMVRLASLVLAIGNARNGVVLVDEIENGIHHSVLPKLWRSVGEVARKFNTQVFATTHSRECILAAHSALREEGDYDFRLYRIELSGDEGIAVAYDDETLEAASEAGLEVR